MRQPMWRRVSDNTKHHPWNVKSSATIELTMRALNKNLTVSVQSCPASKSPLWTHYGWNSSTSWLALWINTSQPRSLKMATRRNLGLHTESRLLWGDGQSCIAEWRKLERSLTSENTEIVNHRHKILKDTFILLLHKQYNWIWPFWPRETNQTKEVLDLYKITTERQHWRNST